MNKLLKRFSSLSPVYQIGLTNHLPMMIVALHELDISKDDIEYISESYVKLKEIPDLHETTYIKTPFENQYITLTNTYINIINNHGIDKAVCSFLRDHKYNLPSALYHGLIRLFYMLKTGDDLQIAQALAYFHLASSDSYIEPGKFGNFDDFNSLKEYRKKTDIKFKDPSTMSKFRFIQKDEFIMKNIFKIEDIASKEKELLDFLTSIYLETRDFYILHIITGFHALYNLQDYFDDYNDVLNQFFLQSQLFLLLNDYSKTYNQYDISDMDKLRVNVNQLLDAHDIKLFYTSYSLNKTFELENLKKIAHYIIHKKELE